MKFKITKTLIEITARNEADFIKALKFKAAIESGESVYGITVDTLGISEERFMIALEIGKSEKSLNQLIVKFLKRKGL